MYSSHRTGCAWRTTPTYMWHEQAEIEWAGRVISIVACCHSVKLCALAARLFQSQQSDALTRMWRWCQVQSSQKECAIGAVHCEKKWMLLQHLTWCCVESVIYHKRDVHRATHKYMWHEQAIIERSRRMISIGACCHNVKLCALPPRAYWSQHKKYTSFSFAFPIHENDQRWTCTWIWI